MLTYHSDGTSNRCHSGLVAHELGRLRRWSGWEEKVNACGFSVSTYPCLAADGLGGHLYRREAKSIAAGAKGGGTKPRFVQWTKMGSTRHARAEFYTIAPQDTPGGTGHPGHQVAWVAPQGYCDVAGG
eukprot:scaffold153286_cov32-Tisochrysis_lutea.AAC.2